MSDLDEAIEAVRYRCEQRLGHLGKVTVGTVDMGSLVYIGLSHTSAEPKRHAISVKREKLEDDPIGVADDISARLIDWHASICRETSRSAVPASPASATQA